QTNPEVYITAPIERVYSFSEELNLEFSVTDEMSGIDHEKTSVTLNGQMIGTDAPILLYTLPIGIHEITVKATDLAGNQASQSVTFETTGSTSDIIILLEALNSE